MCKCVQSHAKLNAKFLEIFHAKLPESPLALFREGLPRLSFSLLLSLLFFCRVSPFSPFDRFSLLVSGVVSTLFASHSPGGWGLHLNPDSLANLKSKSISIWFFVQAFLHASALGQR